MIQYPIIIIVVSRNAMPSHTLMAHSWQLHMGASCSRTRWRQPVLQSGAQKGRAAAAQLDYNGINQLFHGGTTLP